MGVMIAAETAKARAAVIARMDVRTDALAAWSAVFLPPKAVTGLYKEQKAPLFAPYLFFEF